MSTPLPYSLAKEAQAAGAQQALRDLGLLPAAPLEKVAHAAGAAQALRDVGLEKDAAVWGAIGKGLGWLGSKLLSGAGRAGGRVLFGGAREGGKGLIGNVGSLIGGASRTFGKPFEWIGGRLAQGVKPGRGILGFAERHGMSPQNLARLQRLGKGLPSHMGGFGLFSGTASAIGAEPGEDRFKAFGKGFLGGAAMGATMGLGGNVFKMGLGKALGPQRMVGLQRAAAGLPAQQAGQSVLTSGALRAPSQLTNIRAVTGGQRAMDFARKWGAKSALGGGAFLAGDIALAPFDMSITKSVYQMAKGQQPQQPLYAHPQLYTAPMAYAARRYGGGGYMGLQPGGMQYSPYGTGMPWMYQQ